MSVYLKMFFVEYGIIFIRILMEHLSVECWKKRVKGSLKCSFIPSSVEFVCEIKDLSHESFCQAIHRTVC